MVGGFLSHCLGFWLLGGVLVRFSNGILIEFTISSGGSVCEFRWGVASLSEFRMLGWASLCFIRAPPVSRCFCMWWSFSSFSSDLLNILITSLHRALHGTWDGVTWLLGKGLKL